MGKAQPPVGNLELCLASAGLSVQLEGQAEPAALTLLLVRGGTDSTLSFSSPQPLLVTKRAAV